MDAVPFDLRKLVVDAVFGFGGSPPDGVFNSAQFSGAVRREFGLKSCPDGRWVASVLLGLDYVRRIDPDGCHWKYTGDLAPLVGPDGRYDRGRYELRLLWERTKPATDEEYEAYLNSLEC